MTAPMVVVDTRGRTTLELMGIAAGTPGGPVTPPGLRRALPVSLSLLANAGGRRTILPAFDEAPAEYDAGLRVEYDCTDVVRVRLQGWVESGHAGATGSRFVLAATLDDGATWHALDGSGSDTALATAGPTMPLDTAGHQRGASVTLPPALRRVLTFGLFTRDGDGATRPWVGNVAVDLWGDEARVAVDPCPPVFIEPFTTYDDVADLDAVWAPDQSGVADGGAWALGELDGHIAVELSLAKTDIGSGVRWRDYEVSGLSPLTPYRLTALVSADAIIPNVGCGIALEGSAGFVTADYEASAAEAGLSVTLSATTTSHLDGTMALRLKHDITPGAAGTDVARTVRWADIRLSPICDGDSGVNIWPNADFSRADWDAYGDAESSGDPVTDYVSADGGLDGGASLRVLADLAYEEIPVVIPEADIDAEGGAGTWTVSGMIRLTAGVAKLVTPWGATYTTPASWRDDGAYHAFSLTGAWAPTATAATRTFGLRVEGTTPRGNAHFDKLMLTRSASAQPFVEDVP